MLPNIESILKQGLDKTPLVAKMYFAPEVSQLKSGLAKSAKLRAEYQPAEDWYLSYGRNLRQSFSTLYGGVACAYDTYEAISSLPVVGGLLTSLLQGYVSAQVNAPIAGKAPVVSKTLHASPAQTSGPSEQRAIHFNVPRRQTTLNTVQSLYSVGIEGLCAHYESATGGSADRLRGELSPRLEAYANDPSLLRCYFNKAVGTVSTFLNEMFSFA